MSVGWLEDRGLGAGELMAARVEEYLVYELAHRIRALVAQCIAGRVAVRDIPVDHADRVYLIERHVESQAELTGLVAAYVTHSQDAGCPAAIAHREQLDELVDVAD